MGGTFDPVHWGHVIMAKEAARAASLDRVLMIPTGNPPHKKGITSAEHRWRMVCAAAAFEPLLEPCRMELDRVGVIYTVDTLSELHRIYPDAELFYMIGSDTLLELKNWRSYEKVLTLCTFLVCPRTVKADQATLDAECARLESLGGRFIHVAMQPVDVSSTEMRNALVSGDDTKLLPLVCREYAHLAGLYGLPALLPEEKLVWLDRLFETLSRRRFAHTLGVTEYARRLADIHHLDEEKTLVAALLHDCAKCIPEEEMRSICLSQGLTDDPDILASGNLMHAFAGAYMAEKEYGVTDDAVLDAIRRHTMGEPGMTEIDMAVCLADKIELTRKPYPHLEQVREAAQLSLPLAMRMSLEGTEAYVRSRGEKLHPMTAKTLAWLRETAHV